MRVRGEYWPAQIRRDYWLAARNVSVERLGSPETVNAYHRSVCARWAANSGSWGMPVGHTAVWIVNTERGLYGQLWRYWRHAGCQAAFIRRCWT